MVKPSVLVDSTKLPPPPLKIIKEIQVSQERINQKREVHLFEYIGSVYSSGTSSPFNVAAHHKPNR
jgi:hypothetical protein